MQNQVSVVIVCMNKIDNLIRCVDSIYEHTLSGLTFDIWVVAYMFSNDNLEILKSKYPYVRIVESNEIRGFSENNNLALSQIDSECAFVLNDDTRLDSDVISRLYSVLKCLPSNVATLSPKLLYGNGRLQYCGYGEYNWKTILKREYSLNPKRRIESKWCNQKGVFETMNIMGAAFLIKMNVFRRVGFFDERYFFCPEDFALSTKLRQNGFACYVDSDSFLYHYEGGTWGNIRIATMPAQIKGELVFMSQGACVKRYLFAALIFLVRFFKFCCWRVYAMQRKEVRAKIMAEANLNICKSIFDRDTPKETFIRFFNKK